MIPFNAHLANAPRIFAALAGHHDLTSGDAFAEVRATLPSLSPWQEVLLDEFSPIIRQPSCDFISKTEHSWLVIGDRRRGLAAEVRLVIEEHGVGVGLLVLQLQQLRAGHVPTRVHVDGAEVVLAQPSPRWRGERGEHVLQIPARRYRADAVRLAEWGVAKPPALWTPQRMVSHERDGAPCFFCSCSEINPFEVVVELPAARLELDRDLCLGATFAPFGNPATVCHVLAWDRAAQPLSMTLAPGGIGDLLGLTAAVNRSIAAYFTSRGLTQFPLLDGVSNGWAGNSIFHQHYQFFAPEFTPPLAAGGAGARSLATREDISIARFDWPLPVYEIRSAHRRRTAFVAHEVAALWRFLGRGRRVTYKSFAAEVHPSKGDLVPAHTQNLYAPGAQAGRVVWMALRDRAKVDFLPAVGERLGHASAPLAIPKRNLGVLEATGTWIVDDVAGFAAMRAWSEAEISEQIRRMLVAIGPLPAAVAAFEAALPDVLLR